MTNTLIEMPSYVAELITAPLRRMALDPFIGDNLVTCPLLYEDGTELSFSVICMKRTSWFRSSSEVVVSLVHLDDRTKHVEVFFRDVIPFPTGPHDFPFSVRISSLMRAMAWAVARTAGMGVCVDLRDPSD